MHGITFETERFNMRPLTIDDVTTRYQSWFSPETARMGIASARRQPTLEDLRTFIDERVGRPDVLFLGIFVKESGEHIGNLKYEPIDPKNGYSVMGILIGQQEWWGQGITSEVVCPSARWLRSRHGIREIVLGVMKDNLLARRAYEKIGFRLRQTDRIRIDPKIHEAMVWCFAESSP